jgi:ABC-2 type transport system ATP-binding protein
VIELVSLTKRYGGKQGQTAIEDITLTVQSGRVYGLVGSNGAGKTTLLRIIAGICLPTSGSVRCGGRARPSPGTRALVSDEPYVLPQATPETMGRFYRGYYPRWSDAVYARLLSLFGLNGRARIEGFSKGMARQVAIALGLASGAEVLLLDESFDGLDFARRRLIRRLVCSYAHTRDAAVMLTSHNLAEVEDVVDDLGMIDGCRLVFSSSIQELRRSHPGASLEEICLDAGGQMASAAISDADLEALFA